MRNKYPGPCYRCGQHVAAGEGHFERLFGQWRVQHASCAIEHRGKPDEDRRVATAIENARRRGRVEQAAKGTGRRAQRARKRLRDAGADMFE